LAHRVIDLVDEERVAARGTAKTSWFVRIRDAWTPAAKVEGASSELEKNPGPGVVWRRHTRVSLAPGTRVREVVLGPRDLERTPIEHLMKSRSSPRASRERLYSVGSHGELVPEAALAR
jgi:hypothetical protein